MPGKNSNFDRTRSTLIDKYFFTKIYIYISVLIVVIELVGLFRCYYAWSDRRFTLESLILTLFFGFCDA